MNIVNLRDTPSLMDIPAHLRQLADRIEKGEISPEACYVLTIDPVEFEPEFYGWGKVTDRYGLAGIFTLAAKLALTTKEDLT